MSDPTNGETPVYSTCFNCRFWHPAEETPELGLCRRRAPVRIWVYPDRTGDNPPLMRHWPVTGMADWCGEHEAHPDLAAPSQ